MLQRKHPRPKLCVIDRAFLMALRRIWPRWREALIIVNPESVIGWHRAGFACTGAGVRASPADGRRSSKTFGH